MKRRIIKWIAVIVLFKLIVIFAYGTYVYGQVRAVAEQDEARTADAIVVLGAAQNNGRPSKVLKARLDHALALYRLGYARNLVTTGGYGPDPNYSEAQVATRYLTQQGVHPDHIITEQASLTTRDSIRAASLLLQSKSWKTAVVVSDGFHLFRLKAMFADEGITAYASPAKDSPIEASASERLWFSLREVFLFSVYRIADL